MNNNSTFRSLAPYQKQLLLVLASAAAVYLIVQIVVSFFLDPYIGQKLKTSFHTSTRQAYTISFEDLDLSLIGREIELEKVSIDPDSSNLDSTNLWNKVPIRGKLQATNFMVQGISIFDLIFKNKLHIQTVGLQNPTIEAEIIDHAQKEQVDSTKSQENLNRLIYKAIHTHLESLEIAHLEITGASLGIREMGQNKDLVTLQDGMLQLRDITVDSVSAKKKQFFVTDKLQWSTREISWSLPGDLYALKANAVGGSSTDRNAYADSLRLEPLRPKYEFSKNVGQEVDRIDLVVEDIAVQELNFDSLLNSRKFITRSIHAKNARLDIFRDKRLPGGPTSIKPLFHLSFQKMPFPVDIDTLSISNASVAYSEHKPQVSKPGTVTFEELNATFSNFTNIAPDSGQNEPIKLDAQTKVMGTGLLKANFSFFASDTSGRHTIYGSLDSMAVSDLNPILENVGFVHADDGFINSMKFSMELDKRMANGTLTLNYRDLKIKMLEKDKVKEGETKTLTSFIANTFVIKKSNTEQPLRNGKIEFERVEEKSVFNYWWKALLSGLKDNIGL